MAKASATLFLAILLAPLLFAPLLGNNAPSGGVLAEGLVHEGKSSDGHGFPLSISGNPPPPEGDWYVWMHTTVVNETLVVNGSVFVYATLVLENVVLYINCSSAGEHWIEVFDGGNLTARNATIRPVDASSPYYIKADGGSFFYAENCIFEHAGYFTEDWPVCDHRGVWINTTGARVVSCTFSSCCMGLVLYQAKDTSVLGCEFLLCELGFMLRGSEGISFKDCVFFGSSVEASYATDLELLNCSFEPNCYLELSSSDSLDIVNCSFTGDTFGKEFKLSAASLTNFSVENCTFAYDSTASSLVHVSGCSNVSIVRCSFFDNRYTALSVYSASNLTVCLCTFANNMYGATTWGSGCLFYLNNFIDNSEWQACDMGSNAWNNSQYGNYWSNYTGVDADGDGIGDTPYQIDYSTTFDYKPLMYPWQVVFDREPPTTEASVGAPSYQAHGVTYVNSSTPVLLTVSDNTIPRCIYYRDHDLSGAEEHDWVCVNDTEAEAHLSGGDGLHVLAYYGQDVKGNREEENLLVLFLDNTPPSTNATFDNASLALVLAAFDNGCGVNATYYRIAGTSGWEAYEKPLNLALLEPGLYTVEYYSVDNLGNAEEVKSLVVCVPPPVTETYTATETTQTSPPAQVPLLVALLAGLAALVARRRS